METIGVIGLGIIGTPWAARYQATGKLASVWNRTPKPEAPAWKAELRAKTFRRKAYATAAALKSWGIW